MRAEAVIENVVGDLHGIDPVTVHQIADEIMRGLFSPQSVPCSECGGTGAERVYEVTKGDRTGTVDVNVGSCPAGCKDGQVSSPPLALLMGELEQVGERVTTLGPLTGETYNELLPAGSVPTLGREHEVARCFVYRIASGESSPNTEATDDDDDPDTMQPCAGCDSTISTTSAGGWAHDEPGHGDHDPVPTS